MISLEQEALNFIAEAIGEEPEILRPELLLADPDFGLIPEDQAKLLDTLYARHGLIIPDDIYGNFKTYGDIAKYLGETCNLG